MGKENDKCITKTLRHLFRKNGCADLTRSQKEPLKQYTIHRRPLTIKHPRLGKRRPSSVWLPCFGVNRITITTARCWQVSVLARSGMCYIKRNDFSVILHLLWTNMYNALQCLQIKYWYDYLLKEKSYTNVGYLHYKITVRNIHARAHTYIHTPEICMIIQWAWSRVKNSNQNTQ